MIEIRDFYNIQISFNDKLLSQYKISINKTFYSAEKAIKSLIEGLPLSFEKNGEVFVIFPDKRIKKPKKYLFTGQVLDRGTFESLPFSHVIINERIIIADFKGTFAFVSATDSIFTVRFSHLGYYHLDTTVVAGVNRNFLLKPASINLPVVTVKNNPIEKSTQIGDLAGTMKINHQIANFLPGYSDNSLMNLLRLQPGVLASGEQTNDLIIWGSYEGHSQVLFDKFTIYGLKNFNDNISAFNPLVTKDIEVYKGGFDARYGDRVGGIVNATGKNGNTQRPTFTLNINNMTFNGLVEIPFGKKSALLLAVRQTYYNLYDSEDLNLYGTRSGKESNGNGDIVNVNVFPDYVFHDANLKFTSILKNGDLFYVSLYGGNDNFSYDFNESLIIGNFLKKTKEKNTQKGGSLFYGKSWGKGNSTNFTYSYSTLQNDYSDNYKILLDLNNQDTVTITNEVTENKICEDVLRIDHRFAMNEIHTLEGGLGFINNQARLYETNLDLDDAPILMESKENRLNLFVQDNISLYKRVNFKLGFRLNYPVEIQKLYFEPRFSASVSAYNHWKVNAAWGKYNQFVSKSSSVDDEGNYRYLWMVSDNLNTPVLRANHFVLGASYHHNDFTFSLESYRKKTTGLTRYVDLNGNSKDGIYKGKSRSFGLDLFMKKDFHGHSAWVAYSLSKTEELFDYFPLDVYRRAPQDQRHEIKFAGLINWNPYFLSGNYVYGSGFPLFVPIEQQEITTGPSYSRFDVSFVYKFLEKRLKGEIGLSILNVFNKENIKQTNFESVPDYQTNTINIHAEAIPFTPTLFLKLTY